MFEIDRDEIIQLLATEHGILLSKADPLLVTVFLHEIMLGKYRDWLSEQFLELGAGLEVTNKQQLEAGKQAGTDLANKTYRAFERFGNDHVGKLEALFSQQVDGLKKERISIEHQWNQLFWACVISAGVCGLSVAGVIGLMILDLI